MDLDLGVVVDLRACVFFQVREDQLFSWKLSTSVALCRKRNDRLKQNDNQDTPVHTHTSRTDMVVKITMKETQYEPENRKRATVEKISCFYYGGP